MPYFDFLAEEKPKKDQTKTNPTTTLKDSRCLSVNIHLEEESVLKGLCDIDFDFEGHLHGILIITWNQKNVNIFIHCCYVV